MKKDTISILVASDNHFAILLAALIKSIEINHKSGEHINIFVLDDGISKVNKGRLNAVADPQAVSLIWIDTKSIVPKDLVLPIDKSTLPFTTYFRLFAPFVLPADVRKVIYLDVDTIVIEDISKLWNTDIQGKLFAAVTDRAETVSCAWGGIPNYESLGIPAETKYLNAGVLIMDLDKWKESDATNRVLKLMHENIDHMIFADQYGLNAALYQEWFELDARWNWFSFSKHEKPYLVHFLEAKPIFRTCTAQPEFKALFYQYLRLTAWKNHKPVHNYKRLYKMVTTKIKKMSIKLLASK